MVNLQNSGFEEEPNPLKTTLDALQSYAKREAAAQAAVNVEMAIAGLPGPGSKVSPTQAREALGVAAQALGVLKQCLNHQPSGIDQRLLDDLLEASDRYGKIAEQREKGLDPLRRVDTNSADYAAGQLSGIHIAIACLELDDAYIEFEGDEDSPIKFTGISRYYDFDEPGAEWPELRTIGDGTYWERRIGESWEAEYTETEKYEAAFKRWRDRVQQIAKGDG